MEKKKRYRRNKTKFWTLWAILFAVVMIVFTIANVITVSFASIINTTLNCIRQPKSQEKMIHPAAIMSSLKQVSRNLQVTMKHCMQRSSKKVPHL